MVSRLVKAMDALSQADDDDQSDQKITNQPEQPRRKSARLNKSPKAELLHDSGTESDEEEIRNLNSRAEDNNPFATWESCCKHFLPLRLTSSPPPSKDYDTESWYSSGSFGKESGIMTGDNDSDNDGNCTPTPRRRMKDTGAQITKQEDSYLEKRRHSDSQKEDEPIAARLRSNAETVVGGRPMKVAVRRVIPVRVFINRQESVKVNTDKDQTTAPAPKRNRRNSHRPSLDFDKMVKNKIDDAPGPSTSRGSPKKDSIVTRSQIGN